MSRPDPIKARFIGLIVGGGIGGLFLLGSGADPNTGSMSSSFGPATFAGGAIGGWLLGPRAWRAHGRRAWVTTIAELAGVAVLVGDAVVVATVTIHGSASAYPREASAVIGEMLSLYAFGLILLGWLYFLMAL